MGVGLYDKNGNIKSLWRDNMSNTKIDNLTYTYANGDASNKLLNVEDSSGSPEGFKNGATLATEYTYDGNGNLKEDKNKGITNIIYNHLNLPSQITFASGKIEYFYDAVGTKQKKKVTNGTVITTTDYAGNYIYRNNALQFISQPEGYLELDGQGGYDYTYQYKDHLGNIRLSYKDISTTSIPVLQILEENNYYPFGLKHSGYNMLVFSANLALKYKYNGKELQDDIIGSSSLDLYDYGARMYDPALGRWHVQDGKTELYFNWSPYNYALNTPINAIDPDGQIVIFINGYTNNVKEQGKPAYWQRQREVQVYPNGCNNCYQTFTESFDRMAVSHFNDNYDNSLYFDGSLGGNEGIKSRGSLSESSRRINGYVQGRENASVIIQSLARSGGVITESIKVVAHSMGSAYAKGFIQAIVEYAKAHPEECAGLSISEYDFASFQQNDQSAVDGTSLFQYDNEGDKVVGGILGYLLGSGHKKQDGAEESESNANSNGGHSIFDFIGTINNLPEGTYKLVNGEFVKVD